MSAANIPEPILKQLLLIVHALPEAPGCYQYLDESGKIIYVGKAKNLRKRVGSYFNKQHEAGKTRVLVSRIRDIRYIVVATEADALLLENNLIKQHQPRYNVLLKDDKTYPSIAVTKEYLPRIFPTRDRKIRGATYYGPYSHLPTMHALLSLCKELYRPRPCRTLMSQEGVKSGKYQVCLDYHLKRCDAPCVEKQSHSDYLKAIDACREILEGKTSEVMRSLREEMSLLAEEMRFEEAQVLKEKYDLLENFRAKSEIVSSTVHNVDVFHIESDEKAAYINYLHVVKGAITQAFTFEYRKRLDETEAELLALGIIEMRERYQSRSKEIVVPFPVDVPEDVASQTIPQRGEKRQLLELSKLNVKQYKFDRLKQADKLNPEQKSVRLMKEIQQDLGLQKMPYRIELFDNSNISGEDAVAACVVFEQLKPAKKEYRKYHIRTVEGADDYASMREVVRRRYSRVVAENGTLPDLIIADGGRGQMEMIRSVVEDELQLAIPIAGLAKDSRHRTRELLYGFPAVSVGLKAGSQLFRTLTAMQEEVHRFAISFHRNQRSKRQTASVLDQISGVGRKTKELILKEFGSTKRALSAPKEQYIVLLGEKRGAAIYEQLQLLLSSSLQKETTDSTNND